MSEFLRESQWLIWLAVALILGLVELASFDFVFSMLVLGALAGSGAAFFGLDFTGQALSFVIVSLLGLVLIRPALKRWIERSTPRSVTNADALVGRPAIAVVDVTNRSGQVKLGGETWSAVSGDPGVVYPAGTDVTVIRIDGATAVIGPFRPGLSTDLPRHPA